MAFLWVPGPSSGGWSSVAFGNRCKIINRRCKIIRCNIININVKKNRCKIISRRCKIINRKVGLHNCASLLMPAMSN